MTLPRANVDAEHPKQEPTPRVVILGNHQFREFEFIFEYSKTRVDKANFEFLPSFQEIDTEPDSEANVDLVVLCEERRGAVSQSLADEVYGRWPFAGRVLLLGSTLEGEMRTGEPVEGWYRRYWHQWPYFIDSFINQFRRQPQTGIHPAYSATTSTDADRFLQENLDKLSLDAERFADQSIGIVCNLTSRYFLLKELFESIGMESQRLDAHATEPDTDICRIIVSADSFDRSTRTLVEDLTQRFPKTPKCLLLSAPRLDEYCAAIDSGTSRIISQPFLNEELLDGVMNAS